MQIVIQKVADSLAKSESFRREIARFLIKENLLEEGFSLRPTGQGDKFPPPSEVSLKDYVEALVPSEVLDGAIFKEGWDLIRHLEKNWRGKAAIAAVEEALGQPNSDQTLTDQIGRRSVRRFIDRWLAPYLKEYGSERISNEDEDDHIGPLVPDFLVQAPPIISRGLNEQEE
jgi:hypothetical protein